MYTKKIRKDFWTGEIYTKYYDENGRYAGKSVNKYDKLSDRHYSEFYNENGNVESHSILKHNIITGEQSWSTNIGPYLGTNFWALMIIITIIILIISFLAISWGSCICFCLAYIKDRRNKKSFPFLLTGFILLLAQSILINIEYFAENEIIFKTIIAGYVFGVFTSILFWLVLIVKSNKEKYSNVIKSIMIFGTFCAYSISIYAFMSNYKYTGLITTDSESFKKGWASIIEKRMNMMAEHKRKDFEIFKIDKKVFNYKNDTLILIQVTGKKHHEYFLPKGKKYILIIDQENEPNEQIAENDIYLKINQQWFETYTGYNRVRVFARNGMSNFTVELEINFDDITFNEEESEIEIEYMKNDINDYYFNKTYKIFIPYTSYSAIRNKSITVSVNDSRLTRNINNENIIINEIKATEEISSKVENDDQIILPENEYKEESFDLTKDYSQNVEESESKQLKKISIRIGNQIWMKNNLDIVRFRNGDPIPEARTIDEWIEAGNNRKPAWCYYDNNPEHARVYGKLYNGYALKDERGLAPEGWVIPSVEDWDKLSKAINDDRSIGFKLKSSKGWSDFEGFTTGNSNGNGDNSSGFSAFPGGFRSSNGDFHDLGHKGMWWSSSFILPKRYSIRRLMNNSDEISSDDYPLSFGLSIRCIKK